MMIKFQDNPNPFHVKYFIPRLKPTHHHLRSFLKRTKNVQVVRVLSTKCHFISSAPHGMWVLVTLCKCCGPNAAWKVRNCSSWLQLFVSAPCCRCLYSFVFQAIHLKPTSCFSSAAVFLGWPGLCMFLSTLYFSFFKIFKFAALLMSSVCANPLIIGSFFTTITIIVRCHIFMLIYLLTTSSQR